MTYDNNAVRLRPLWKDNQKLPEIVALRNRIVKASERISFDPGPHVYTDTLTGVHPVCVSNVVASFDSFEAEKKAAELSWRDAATPGAKYYGKSPEQILAEWKAKADEAASRGSLRHSFAEACFCVATGSPEEVPDEWRDRLSDDGTLIRAVEPEEIAVTKAYHWMPDHLVPYMKETQVYHETFGYAGTFDLLAYDLHAKYSVLEDWKTNASLDKGHFSYMKAPFNDLWDTPLSHYEIQQSLYQMKLEELAVPVIARYLLHIQQSGDFTPVRIPEHIALLRCELSKRLLAGLTADGKPRQ